MNCPTWDSQYQVLCAPEACFEGNLPSSEHIAWPSVSQGSLTQSTLCDLGGAYRPTATRIFRLAQVLPTCSGKSLEAIKMGSPWDFSIAFAWGSQRSVSCYGMHSTALCIRTYSSC
jgi:hypothetical protein